MTSKRASKNTPPEKALADSAENADMLDDVLAIAVAGIAALEVLADILPEHAKSVEESALVLTSKFKTLAEAAQRQGEIANALSVSVDFLEINGHKTALTDFAKFFDDSLDKIINRFLFVSQKVYTLNASLKALKAQLSPQALAEVKPLLEAMTADLKEMSTLDVVMKVAMKDRLAELIAALLRQHAEAKLTMQESVEHARKISAATSALIVGLQFQDRHFQIVENTVAIIKRHMSALEDLHKKLLEQVAQKEGEPRGKDYADKIIEVIKLAEIRKKYIERLIQSGVMDKTADASDQDSKGSIEDNIEWL